jgi:hypothetical protein
MLKKISFLLLLSTLTFAFPAQAQKRSEAEKTYLLDQAFHKKGERYFSFYVQSKSQINSFSRIVSIDKVEGLKVYAYASRIDFEKFLETGLKYQLLESPNAFYKADMYHSALKKTYAYDQFLTYDDYVSLMYKFATDYPSICQVFSLGQSVEGREILVAKISDNVSIKEAEPQFLYTGQIHGDEIVASNMMLRLIDYLTSNYGSDAQTNRLVDGIEIWINPLSNPDGLYAGGDNTINGAQRFNANNVDLNRNFPDPKSGNHPDNKAWQPETLIFMALADAQHFVMSANTHSGTTVVNYPWDTWSRRTADDNWWQFVSREYADLAQLNSDPGYMEAFNSGITDGYDWYSIDGGRQDYMNYFHHCREVTIEQSVEKMLPADTLNAHWNYNRQAMLNYLEEVTFGFRGRITDQSTGNPLQAKVEIEGHDFDESYVITDDQGYYYRPIKAGTYSLAFSAEGYESKSINNQSIADFESKTLDVQLTALGTGLHSDLDNRISFPNPLPNHQLKIKSTERIEQLQIFSINGQELMQKNVQALELHLNLSSYQSGIYFIKISFKGQKPAYKSFIIP